MGYEVLARKWRPQLLADVMSISDYFRTFCESAELPGAFLDMLPDRHREFIEKHISQTETIEGKNRYVILTRLVSQCIEHALDNGFFVGFKRH